jgi:hypothetical protein
MLTISSLSFNHFRKILRLVFSPRNTSL